MIVCGAIDLGGTKIEARAFDDGLRTIEVKRIATPTADFDAFMAGLCAQIDWLYAISEQADLPIGVSLAGIINPKTGLATASNIPVSGRNIGAALKARYGRHIPLINDCMALAYSEANGGAGQDYPSVVGLIVGTGVGAGFCVGGVLPSRHSGLAVEIGHIGMPAQALARHDLPLWPCGCGKTGCMERYMSGSALTALFELKTGETYSGKDIVARARAGDEMAKETLLIWADLVAECLFAIQMTLDPACIVLGGGASLIDGLIPRLSQALKEKQLSDTGQPDILLAQHGDSSGARGMALMAMKTKI
jgi:N-acetylglucosamine kinase